MFSLRKFNRFLIIFKDVALRTFKEFRTDHCPARAGSLSYSTLMAVVPLSAFIVALLTAFGSFGTLIDELQIMLIDIFIPAMQDDVSQLFDQFLNNSQTLGTVGFFLFAITSINLIDNISLNINVIWGVQPKGNLLSKFSKYTSSLLFGVLLIAVSFTGRSILIKILPSGVNALGSFLVVFVPSLFMYTAILLLIGFVPGVKVDLKYAALSAFLGVIFFEIAKKGFVEGSSYVLRASVMYGSLALIPIFLFWLYIVWMIILASAELTFSLQFHSKPWSIHSFAEMVPAQRFSLGLQIYIMIASAFRSGDQPPGKKKVAKRFGISLEDVSSFVTLFVESNLMRTVGKDEWAMVPAKPLDTVTLKDILASIAGTALESPETPEYFLKTWKSLEEKMDILNDTTIDDYLIEKLVDEV